MKIAFAPMPAPETGTLVVLASAAGQLGARAAALDGRTAGAITRALQLAGETFKRGHVLELLCPAGLELERLVVLSLGKPEEATPLDLETLGGALVVKLTGLGVQAARLVAEPIEGLAAPSAELAVHLASGASLRSYRFDKYRTQPEEAEGDGEADGGNRRPGVAELTVHLDDPAAAEALWRRSGAVVEAVAHGRDLVTEPANVLSPAAFADACRELGASYDGLEVEILEPHTLGELGMNTLLAVSQGSVREPRVVVMRWSGGRADEPPLALVGKGVCFDSGGLSLKPAGGMEEMKWDMGGAAAVFGAMQALAARQAKANVVGVLGLTENMPSGRAQRPGDVVTSMAGLTIEVVNTDAEGRLVLADVLHYTKDRFKPQAMVDLATLTGAIIVALGHEQAGLFSPDDALAGRLLAAGAAVGEQLWRMPLGEAYAKHVKSEIADVKNVGRAREAGATAGAVFLQKFVGDVPWAHLDIAGVAWTKRDLDLAPKGATGFGIRLLDRLIADHFER